jgi:hypothetical protein
MFNDGIQSADSTNCRALEALAVGELLDQFPNVLDVQRIAISNNRLVKFEDGKVTFRWKDYKRKNRSGLMTLDANEFIRRFLIHVLPRGFMRLRHYGLFANRDRANKLAKCRLLLRQPELTDTPAPKLIDWKSRYEALTGISFDACPACRQGRMLCVEVLASLVPTSNRCRPPPGGETW